MPPEEEMAGGEGDCWVMVDGCWLVIGPASSPSLHRRSDVRSSIVGVRSGTNQHRGRRAVRRVSSPHGGCAEPLELG
jgi:hypothetical protein